MNISKTEYLGILTLKEFEEKYNEMSIKEDIKLKASNIFPTQEAGKYEVIVYYDEWVKPVGKIATQKPTQKELDVKSFNFGSET